MKLSNLLTLAVSITGAAVIFAGCSAVAEEKNVFNPKTKAAYFRVANFSNGPVELCINGLPVGGPLDYGAASVFTKRRKGEIKVIYGSDPLNTKARKSEFKIEEPGATMYLTGNASNPKEVVIENDTRAAGEGNAILRVVNLTSTSIEVDGVGDSKLKVAPNSGSTPVPFDVTSKPISIMAGGKSLSHTLDMEDNKVYVIVVSARSNMPPGLTVLMTPEKSALETTKAAAAGG